MNSDLNVSTYSSISHPWKMQTPALHTYSSTADNLPNKSIIKHATIHSDSNSISGIHKRLLWAISGISTHIKHMYGVLHPGNTVSHPHSNPSVLHYRKQTLPAWQAFVISYLTFFFQNASLLLCQCLLLSTLRMPVCECVCVCVCSWGWVITAAPLLFRTHWYPASTTPGNWIPLSPGSGSPPHTAWWLHPELCNEHRIASDIIHLFNRALMETRRTASGCLSEKLSKSVQCNGV